MSAFHAVTFPTARKRYHCEECGRSIEPGERHTKSVGTPEVYDYRLIQVRYHDRCVSGYPWWQEASK